MSFPIHVLSQKQFEETCASLAHLGNSGHERLEIRKDQLGNYVPSTTSSPGWIEWVLRLVFRYKPQNQRLNEVSNFALNWLRAHSLKYDGTDFITTQASTIENLRPLMKKAHLEKDFDELISQVKERCAMQLQSGVKLPSLKFQWPTDFQTSGQAQMLETFIREVLAAFLRSPPGTTITRAKKTTVVTLKAPEQAPTSFNLAVKVDFYLSTNSWQIIVKTGELVGSGAQRKVKRAFNVLTGQELVSLPLINDIEKFFTDMVSSQQLSGFLPIVANRTPLRIYQPRCAPLSSIYSATPIIKLRIAIQLTQSLKAFHELVCSYSYVDDANQKILHPSLPVYHSDIKPANILVSLSQPLEAIITDLGTTSRYTEPFHTLTFAAPEKLSFFQTLPKSPSEIVSHNQNYGQTNDVWGLGLTLTSLLSGGQVIETTNGTPQLPCFKKFLDNFENELIENKKDAKLEDFWHVNRITQEEMDRSIENLAQASDSQLRVAWNAVKSMLIVNYKKRITAAEAAKVMEIALPAST